MARIILEITKPDNSKVAGEYVIEDDQKFKNQVDAFLRHHNHDPTAGTQKKALEVAAKELSQILHTEAKMQRTMEKNQTAQDEIDEELGEQPGAPLVQDASFTPTMVQQSAEPPPAEPAPPA